MADNITYGPDGEIRAADTTSEWELNWHPDTPEHVELGRYVSDGDGYAVLAYFNVTDLKTLVAQIEEEN